MIDPDLCSWKNMHDFIMNSEPEKAAPVYESCRRALMAHKNQYPSSVNVVTKNKKPSKKDRKRHNTLDQSKFSAYA